MRNPERLALIVCLCLLLEVACSSHSTPGSDVEAAHYDRAWQAVTETDNADTQRTRLEEFLRSNDNDDVPALRVSVRSLVTGDPIDDIDQALWENPQQYEIILHYGPRSHAFVPLSEASLEPLLRE